VGLAEGAALFGKEALSFQVLFARLEIIKIRKQSNQIF
jgi:hypothetical protein